MDLRHPDAKSGGHCIIGRLAGRNANNQAGDGVILDRAAQQIDGLCRRKPLQVRRQFGVAPVVVAIDVPMVLRCSLLVPRTGGIRSRAPMRSHGWNGSVDAGRWKIKHIR